MNTADAARKVAQQSARTARSAAYKIIQNTYLAALAVEDGGGPYKIAEESYKIADEAYFAAMKVADAIHKASHQA